MLEPVQIDRGGASGVGTVVHYVILIVQRCAENLAVQTVEGAGTGEHHHAVAVLGGNDGFRLGQHAGAVAGRSHGVEVEVLPVGAVLNGFIGDVDDAVREVDSGQVGASVEGAVFHGDQRIGQGQEGETALGKGARRQLGHGLAADVGGDHHFLVVALVAGDGELAVLFGIGKGGGICLFFPDAVKNFGILFHKAGIQNNLGAQAVGIAGAVGPGVILHQMVAVPDELAQTTHAVGQLELGDVHFLVVEAVLLIVQGTDAAVGVVDKQRRIGPGLCLRSGKIAGV